MHFYVDYKCNSLFFTSVINIIASPLQFPSVTIIKSVFLKIVTFINWSSQEICSDIFINMESAWNNLYVLWFEKCCQALFSTVFLVIFSNTVEELICRCKMHLKLLFLFDISYYWQLKRI